MEGVAGPAGCDGKGAGLRAGDARCAADAGAEEEGRDLARHCVVPGGGEAVCLISWGGWLEVLAVLSFEMAYIGVPMAGANAACKMGGCDWLGRLMFGKWGRVYFPPSGYWLQCC